ncbi:MAG TPA: hypothetical protein VLH79_13690 [Chthonomonadales bacterium]|nr:hypothetical protein [Chthonomonadales bacterium]
MVRTWLSCLAAALLAGLAAPGLAQRSTPVPTPGLAPSHVDAEGRLVQDWGTLGIALSGEGVRTGPPSVSAVSVAPGVPGVRVVRDGGVVALEKAVFRAPVWPAGLDVVTVRLASNTGRDAPVRLTVQLPQGARVGRRLVTLGGRALVGLPESPTPVREVREWGHWDEATDLPGWARPESESDPAFRNIRAGMGGVPIAYRFSVQPGAAANVFLGFCESHWQAAGQRPLVCQVEGAPLQEVDPIARWGVHRPGVVLFAARDANGDGKLDIAVLPKPGAPDTNPILNAIWLFPAGAAPTADAVVSGRMNALATRVVDVGGPGDQALEAAGALLYDLVVPSAGMELTLLVASPGASVELPGRTAWTPETLRAAAARVMAEWRGPASR